MIANLERRPLLTLFLGLLAGCSTRVEPWWALVPAILLFLLSPVSRRFLLGFYALGVAIGPSPDVEFEPVERFWEGQGRVVSVPMWTADSQTARLATEQGRFMLRVSADQDLSLGDTVAFRAFVQPPSESAADYYRRIGTRGLVLPLSQRVEVLGQGPWPFRVGLAWRRAFVETVDQAMSPEAADWMKALCFNVRGSLDDSANDQLSRTGTAHIVSASGLHVLILAFGIHGLLGLLPLPRAAQVALLLLVLAIYAGAAGLRPPVLRAVAMGALFFSSYLFKREPDGLSAVAVAGSAELLWSPGSVLDMGFQLSYLTAASLSLFIRFPIERATGMWDAVRDYFVGLATVSLVAFLASAPLVAYHFGVVSLSSIGTNMLVVPVAFVVVLVGMLALPATLAFPEVARFVYGDLVQPLVGWMVAVIEGVAQWPLAAVYVPPVPAWLVVAIYLGFALGWSPTRRTPVLRPSGILP